MSISKNRRIKIKKTLHDFNSNKELVEVYDNLIKRYEDIKEEQGGTLENWQQNELITWKRIRLQLFMKVEALEKGIKCLNKNEGDKLEEIIKHTYLDSWLRVKVADKVGLSEDRVNQLLNIAYERLDKFLIN